MLVGAPQPATNKHDLTPAYSISKMILPEMAARMQQLFSGTNFCTASSESGRCSRCDQQLFLQKSCTGNCAIWPVFCCDQQLFLHKFCAASSATVAINAASSEFDIGELG
jgi:hypothetical protein